MSNTTTTSCTLTFGDSDTGWAKDDLIWITDGAKDDLIWSTDGTKATAATNKKTDYKKVHVARRRLAKKLARPEIYKITNLSSTSLTVNQASQHET